MRDTTGERMHDAFVESTTRAGKTAVEITGDLNATVDTTGLATSALQVSGNNILNDILSAVGGGGTGGGGSSANADILGSLYTGQQNNQIEINFETTANPDLITNTTTSTGSITISNGHTLYATGTGVTSSAKGVSVKANAYRPLNESYSGFSAAFTTPTSANSHQRIGLYDTSNGFFIGFEGLTFGVTKRAAGVDSFVARSSFSDDQLTGAVGSKFTRDGVPEALNLNLSNLFRIRFAWLGSAPIYFEVFSPDGTWVVFHKIKQPNLSLNPSINNPDLPMTIDVSKSASNATNLIMYTACWAAGTTSVFTKITDTLTDQTLAALTRSVITGKTTGGGPGGGYVNVKVNPSGALTTETTQAGTWSITNVTGTVSLPTGASTSALQTTGNGILSSILSAIGGVLNIRSLVFASDRVDASGSSVSVSNFPATQAVSDGGGSLTVDGTVAATQSGAWSVGITGTPTVTVGNASLAVTGPLTDAELRASAVPISGTVTANTGLTQPLTDTQLRASAVPVSGTFFQATQPVSLASIPLATNAATDRTTAAAPYSNRLSDGTAFYDARQVRALTSADVVTVANPTTSVSITGTPNVAVTSTVGLTDSQLRASAVPVSAASLPLPTGAATETTLNKTIGVSTGGTQGAITMTTAGTTYSAQVGASPVANRTIITVTPTTADIYWGYTNTVTTASGTPILRNTTVSFTLNPASSALIYLVSASGAVNVRITEAP